MILVQRYKEFKDMLLKSSTRPYSSFQIFRLYIDFLFNRAVRGVYLIDYIQYKFYDRNLLSRESFMEYQKLHKLMDRVNNIEKKDLFDKKPMFNKVFDEYLNRNWLNINDSNFEEFVNFLNKNKNIIAKPGIGSFGKGIGIFNSKDILEGDTKKYFEDFKKQDVLVEAVLVQHPDLAKFNDTSVNTLRITTFIDGNGKPHVMNAVIRIGRKGNVTDNFHNHGIAAKVDLETGVVSSVAIDKNFKQYINHPDSNVQIIGYKFDKWDKIMENSLNLAMVVPDVRYVGWDIAVDKNGYPVCIEGNFGADPDASQTTDQIGKYFDFVEKI